MLQGVDGLALESESKVGGTPPVTPMWEWAQQFLITNEVDPLFQEKGEVVINNEEGPCAKAEPDLPCSNTLDSLLGGKRLKVTGETKTRAR